MALKVTADFEPKIEDGKISVEHIQDSVESVLIKAGYDDVSKAYIIYRRQREKIRNSNRVAAIAFGPKSVIVIAGYNKLVKNLFLKGTDEL